MGEASGRNGIGARSGIAAAALRRAGALALALAAAGCTSGPGGLGGGTEVGPIARAALDCDALDPQAEGVADGAAGIPPRAGLARLSECPDFAGLRAEDAYLAGHAEGRARYCRPETARALAREGIAPTLACPPGLRRRFQTAYAAAAAEAGRDAEAARRDAGLEADRDGGWRPRISPSIGIGIGSGGLTTVGGGVGVTFFRPPYAVRYGHPHLLGHGRLHGRPWRHGHHGGFRDRRVHFDGHAGWVLGRGHGRGYGHPGRPRHRHGRPW